MINSFTGRYEFLSNFFVEQDGLTLEHRFQASKTTNPAEQDAILAASTPGIAKRLGRRATLRPDWDEKRIEVMTRLVLEKFSNEPLRSKLIATEPHELIEGNNWHDYFWGVCNGRGENWLGRILVEVRAELGNQ